MNFAPFCSWDSMSPSTCCEFQISSREEIKYHARLDELERVDETAVDLSNLSLNAGIVILDLAITSTGIHARTFGERVVVAGRSTVVLEVHILRNIRLVSCIRVVKTGRQSTGAQRSSSTEMQAIALHITDVVFKGIVETSNSGLMLEILTFNEELHNFEIIVAAHEDQLAVLVELTPQRITITIKLNTILRQFIADCELGRTIFTRLADGCIALSIRGAFSTSTRILAIRLKGILDGGLQTGKSRGLVDNHVVVAIG